MQHNRISNKDEGDAMSQVSMKNGFWFYFDHDGNDISVHGSAWSGKETVYVNNHPVSIKRVLTSRTSIHQFKVKDTDYRIVFKMASIIMARLSVSLYANDELVSTEEKAYHANKMSVLKKASIGFICGFAVSMAVFHIIDIFFGK